MSKNKEKLNDYNKKIGTFGENIASKYLKNKKYEIITQNFKGKFGEIDIIAKKEEVIRFVEVKARTNLRYGTPIEGISLKKQHKIIQTANEFILNIDSKFDYVFDVIEIYFENYNGKLIVKKINHVKNAFEYNSGEEF